MLIGSTLKHYQILQALGRGGMGEVYLARDTTLNRYVALKVLRSDVVADRERRARFEREARAVAALNHPNIVTLHSIEAADEVHFITMEWVSGRTLAEVTPPHGLPLTQFFDLSVPLVEAVGAAHAEGITHRDLKPENVMVTEAGRVKVLDFGLAKLKAAPADESAETALTRNSAETGVGQIVGTFAYMSPEQIEARPLDHRSDIFSLGIMLHEMLTGRRPFVGETNASTMAAILKDAPRPVTELNSGVPPRLAAVVQRCMEKDPALRYQSAADLASELAVVRRDFSSGVRTAEARPTRASSSSKLYALVAVALVAAAAVAALILRNRSAAPGPVREMAFVQLTHGQGAELFPTLSPDGRTLVYASAAAGNLDLYSLRVGGQNPVNLTADSAVEDTQPAFAPDGERLAFRSERDGGGIFVMGATGESVRRLTDFGYHPAWSPDSAFLLVCTQSISDPAFRFTASELWSVNVATGEKRRLLEADAAQASWSPNGRRIAFWGRGERGAGDIWTVASDGSAPVKVTTEAAIDWNPVWAPDGRSLYFSSNRGGAMSVWQTAIDERSGKVLGTARPLTTGGGASSQHITVSNDGSRVAYAALVETMNVQSVAFDPKSGTTAGEQKWITRGSRPVAQPDASPDGTHLAFNSTGKQEDIFVSRTSGAGLRQLTDDPAKDRAARWSPDARLIAFYSDRSGEYEIWTIKPDASDLQQLTRSPGAHYPVWSPEGRRMAYSSHSPNAAYIFEVTKPWAQQQPLQLPAIADKTQTFEIWSWSPDGRRLAGQKHLADLSHAGIAVHEIGTAQIEWLTDFGEWPLWLSDNRRLLFSHQGKLHLVDSATKKVQEVLSLPQPSLGSVALSRDEKTIYFTFRAAESDVWLITLK